MKTYIYQDKSHKFGGGAAGKSCISTGAKSALTGKVIKSFADAATAEKAELKLIGGEEGVCGLSSPSQPAIKIENDRSDTTGGRTTVVF
ncbi:hypothetical protein MJ569_10750 [Escherichia coli]|nr:hypothetical protein MJ569_10750 [Escherichia coli]